MKVRLGDERRGDGHHHLCAESMVNQPLVRPRFSDFCIALSLHIKYDYFPIRRRFLSIYND